MATKDKEIWLDGMPPKAPLPAGIGFTPSEPTIKTGGSFGQPEQQGGFAPQNLTLNTDNTPTPTQTETPTAPKYKGYDDIINLMTQRQQTEEQRAEEARRAARLARTHKAVGGIADLGRALSNLYFTTQYAPNAYDPKQGMSAKAQERYDQAVADYEARQDRALNYALTGAKYRAADNAAEYERWKDDENMKLAKRKQDEIERRNNEQELYNWAKLDEQKSWHALQDAYNNRRLSIQDYNAISNRMRATSMVEYRRNGGNMTPYIVTTSYEYDPISGKVTEVKKERTVGGGEVVVSRVAVTNGEEVQQPQPTSTPGSETPKHGTGGRRSY